MSGIQPHNEKSASVWNSGGGRYDEISRGIADSIEHCVLRLDPKPGEKILDLRIPSETKAGVANEKRWQKMRGLSRDEFDAYHALPPDQADALILRYYEGRSVKDMAASLGDTEKATSIAFWLGIDALSLSGESSATSLP